MREKKQKNWVSPYYNKPVSTRDTAVRVRGVSRCTKTPNRTRTRDTRFGKPAGFPVPVRKPNNAASTDLHAVKVSEKNDQGQHEST